MCTCTLTSCVHTHTHRHRVGAHSNIYQATYACLTQSCDMKCNWSVLFTTFRTNCCPHVLIICGEVDVCGDEETKDEKLTKVMFLLENVEVLSKLDMWMSTAVVKHHYGVNQTMICFTKKNEHEISRSKETNVPSISEFTCVSQLSLPLPQSWKRPYVYDWKMMQKLSPVSGDDVRKVAMPVKSSLKTVPKIQESSIPGPPYSWKGSMASASAWSHPSG